MKATLAISLILSLLFIACGNTEEDNNRRLIQEEMKAEARIPDAPYTSYNSIDDSDIGKIYVPTGFYYLTTDEGIKMMRDRSNEVYNLNRLPFVSARNMTGVRMNVVLHGEDTITALVITLDKEGARSLADGTGNPAYPYIAVVIGGRLLDILKNATKVPGNEMSVLVQGYTQAQIDEMEMAIRKKR